MFENFKSDFQEALQSCQCSFDAFDNHFTSNLNKRAPKKKEIPRGNENLMRAIMKSSKFKNKANKTKNLLNSFTTEADII